MHWPRLPPGKDIDLDEDKGKSRFFPRGIFARLGNELSEEGRVRFFDEFMPLLHTTKQRVLESHDQKSWYLVYIGTKPESRGKGYAKKLIEDVTRQVRWLTLDWQFLANVLNIETTGGREWSKVLPRKQQCHQSKNLRQIWIRDGEGNLPSARPQTNST